MAAPIDIKARQGISLAQKGNCEKAVPILEDVELERHRPSSAYALASCYQKQGKLVQAAELFRVTSKEKPIRGWTRDDHNAKARARKKASDLDAIIPTLKFKVAEDYEDLEVEVDGRPVSNLNEPRQHMPEAQLTISARAKDKKEMEEKITLSEGERRVYVIQLEKADPNTKPTKTIRKSSPDKSSGAWAIGARFRGILIPKFLMNAFGDGGTTLFAPGADLVLSKSLSDADLAISVGYSSYRMGEVPYKPKGRPDTEYEILQSDLQSLLATVDLLWNIPLDSHKRWSFRIGGGIGIGWTFLGNLYRTQAYPASGVAGNPYEYIKCRGPNQPLGTFRYCNQLDKDATHYNGYVEPNWFQGGVRPLIYPWLTFPQIGISWRIAPKINVDVDTGLSISGFMGMAGLRYEL